MLMTVQKLIDELQKVENKNQEVWMYVGDWSNDFEVIQESDGTITLDDPNNRL